MGEIDLLLAILHRAFMDLRGDVVPGSFGLGKRNKKHMKEQIKKDAKKWVLSESDELGSFYWVCVNLDMDPDCLRDGLRTRGLI